MGRLTLERVIVSIDPGAKAGIAMWIDRELFRARDFRGDDPRGPSCGAYVIDSIVCEIPHSGEGKASVDDRIKLALRAGLICARVSPYLVPRFVQPSTWKGQQSKEACHAKARKVLSANEKVIFDCVGEDARDAIAIGLWALNR